MKKDKLGEIRMADLTVGNANELRDFYKRLLVETIWTANWDSVFMKVLWDFIYIPMIRTIVILNLCLILLWINIKLLFICLAVKAIKEDGIFRKCLKWKYWQNRWRILTFYMLTYLCFRLTYHVVVKKVRFYVL